jgi:S-adenosylmethionine:tRNA ribosyltransferase-isomerase
MEEILIEDYNYPLPDERIAKYPLAKRDTSKLLVYRDGQVSEDGFAHVGEYLSPSSLLVYNNTRVIQARLEFHKEAGDEAIRLIGDKARGARIEIFCLEPLEPHDYQLSLGSTEGCTWKCMIGNAKKWKSGALSQPVILPSGEEVRLRAEKGEQTGNTFSVRFSWEGASVSFAEILDAVGELPIPPYLNRDTQEVDYTRYQTVYSKFEGSVAAPTAGLHFTNEVIEQLNTQGIETREVTLHVGAGTFLPVKEEDATRHPMHTEHFEINAATLSDLIRKSGNITAVGTTSVRTLESLSALGYRVMTEGEPHTERVIGQFELYDIPQEIEGVELLKALAEYMESNGMTTLKAATQIMIVPSFKFRVVNQIVTNFHQPKSTLLLLISAFIGDDWHNVYRYAMDNDFRFLSYGDSSLLFPAR